MGGSQNFHVALTRPPGPCRATVPGLSPGPALGDLQRLLTSAPGSARGAPLGAQPRAQQTFRPSSAQGAAAEAGPAGARSSAKGVNERTEA